MLKRLRNNKGITGAEVLVICWALQAAMLVPAVVKTAANGVLVNNAKVIGCKAANKGEEFCNAKYGYTPKEELVEVKRGGKLRAKLLAMQNK